MDGGKEGFFSILWNLRKYEICRFELGIPFVSFDSGLIYKFLLKKCQKPDCKLST